MSLDERVLVECDLNTLRDFVLALERRHEVRVLREPAACLTLLRAADSLDGQEFYLGEAISTDCTVAVDGHAGYGLCLGDEPQRSYCLAVIDALTHAGLATSDVASFVDAQALNLDSREAEEASLVARTLVDFKLMDQE